MPWLLALVVFAWLGPGSFAVGANALQLGESLVHGRITAPEGGPVAGASVEPRSLDRPRARIPEVGNVSGVDGRYEWPLPAGTYEIAVWAEGYERVTKQITVRPGQTATLDFRLTRTGRK